MTTCTHVPDTSYRAGAHSEDKQPCTLQACESGDHMWKDCWSPCPWHLQTLSCPLGGKGMSHGLLPPSLCGSEDYVSVAAPETPQLVCVEEIAYM